ncbi:hypothetical protein RvY_06368 [Ramazzottius varieornatus]|uniref:Nuclear respiratory factor 1 NLS/DNA-binding dimerisation domain-containing protein n=1 Tax=Ramazzottius varieornatus TaxID=947166 RepID=A0A1D1UYA7_RAMVA|nr:hypothetical protein RvY_06368 [Ramazzottius varieornatus]
MDLDDFLEVELSTIPQVEDVESDTRSEVSNADSMDSDAANDSSDAIMRAAVVGVSRESPFVNTLTEYGSSGMAAATAILSGARRGSSKEHHFETNPAVRRRHQTRLLRKIRALCHEYSARVGQQAVFVAALPAQQGDPETETFKIVGSSPFDTVLRNIRQKLMMDLNTKLTQIPPRKAQSSGTREERVHDNKSTGQNSVDLPCLLANGIPVSLNDMTQAMLRNFIPVILKHSTGRGKAGWGRPSLMPLWWPEAILPWASVRNDTRSTEQKQSHSWTFALKESVKACYNYHHQEYKLAPFPAATEPPARQPEVALPQTTHLLPSRITGMNGDGCQTGSAFQMVEPLLTDLNGALDTNAC